MNVSKTSLLQKMQKRKPLFVLFLAFLAIQILLVPRLSAQNHTSIKNFWKDTEINLESPPDRTSPLPREYRFLTLQVDVFSSWVQNAPKRFVHSDSDILISLPLENGELETFKVFSSPVFDENLAKKYPEQSSYYIQNIENEHITGRVHLTTSGVYGLIVHADNKMTYIEPYSRDNEEYYIAYDAKNQGTLEQHAEFSCNMHQQLDESSIQEFLPLVEMSDCSLRKFRFAVSATGEYTQWHGGSVEQALVKIMILTGNTNAVLEREIGVTLELIDGNEEIVFTNPDTDPFSGDDNLAMLEENASIISNAIGNSNFDIGMVVAISGGGLASFYSVCNISRAKGVAGSTWSPEGYPLEATFIHELGHKLGATHSFNNSCNSNRNTNSSYEPGSGSSIMSYAGACAPSVTYPRESYFHKAGLERMRQYVHIDLSATCGEIIPISNTSPTVNAGTDKSLPLQTPFELSSEISNPQNDAQSYSWEQMDKEIAPMPPLATSTIGPAFRSFPPKNTIRRSFPSLECFNETNSTVNCDWEVLPAVPRVMNFDLTIRRIKNGIGCSDSDGLVLNFIDTGSPFEVVFPNGGEVISPLQFAEIQWNVAGTDSSPINSSLVSISLSTDGGRTFPYVLEEETANDGSSFVEFPNVNSEDCFIKISSIDHIFFDISDAAFTLSNIAEFTLNPIQGIYTFCEDTPNTFSFDVNITSETNFSDPISFPASDNTGSLSISFSPSIVVPPGVTTVEIVGNLDLGENLITVVGTSNNQITSAEVSIQISNSSPNIIQLESPAQGSIGIEYDVALEWTSQESIFNYEVELADDPTFENPFITEVTETNNLDVNGLGGLKVYYWRVRGLNGCGEGEWSQIFAFKTKNETCSDYSANNTPRELLGNEHDDAFAIIEVNDDFILKSAAIKDLIVEHTHIGDLSGIMIAPSGVNIDLFYRPGFNESNPYGCVRDNLNVGFDDNASQTYAQMWSTCETEGNAISGVFQPLTPLANFIGESSEGLWLFNLNDLSDTNGGQLLDVTLTLCRDDLQPSNDLTITNETLFIDQYENAVIDENEISSSSSSSEFQVISLPQNGTLRLNSSTLNIGDIFTVSDLQNNDLEYEHNGSSTTEDRFYFDVTNASNEWSGIEEFLIDITLLAPVASISITNPLDCMNDSMAEVEVDIEFGTPPFMYSLDGEFFQESNTFSGLSAGIYSFFVSDEAGYVVESVEIIITNPEPISAVLTTSELTITVEAEGGTGNYTYQLNDGDFQSSNIFTVNEDSEYWITVMDENECTFQISTVINNLSASLELLQGMSCHDVNDASIVVQVSGGIAPFQYRLDEGDFQNENTFTDLGEGAYSVEVLDATGLQINTSTITIENPQNIEADITVTGYEIEVNVNNEFAPFLYNFDNSEFFESNSYQGMPLTNHEIIVQNANGCINTFSAEITTSPPTIAILQTVDISCFDENDGQITVVPSQGVAPYEYKLEDFEFQSGNIFSNLSSGIYSFEIRDSGGFVSEIQSVELDNPDLLSFTAQSIGETIEIIAEGGTGTLSYSLDQENYQEENTFHDFGTGVYILSVRDENGCEESIEYTHYTNSFVVVAGLEVISPCVEIAPVRVEICINGGIAPYVISANPPYETLIELEDENCVQFFELEFIPSTSGDIEVIVDDEFGSQFTNVLTVPDFEILDFIYELEENNLSVIATSGTAPYQFSIDGVNYQNGGFFPNLENGTYTISVMDAEGCESEQEVLVDVTSTTDNAYNEVLFVIYPNPTSDIIQLEMENKEFSETEISIYNLAGKQMHFENISSQNLPHTLELKNYPSGMYEVIVQQGEKIGRQKLVIISK